MTTQSVDHKKHTVKLQTHTKTEHQDLSTSRFALWVYSCLTALLANIEKF